MREFFAGENGNLIRKLRCERELRWKISSVGNKSGNDRNYHTGILRNNNQKLIAINSSSRGRVNVQEWGGKTSEGNVRIPRAETNSLPLPPHDRKASTRQAETRRRHIRVYDVSHTSHALIPSGAISRDIWLSQILQQTVPVAINCHIAM